VTVTGLVGLDLTTLAPASAAVHLVLILLGGTVLASTSLPAVRWWHVRAALARRAGGARVEAGAPPPGVDARAWAARVLLRDTLALAARLVVAYWAAAQLAVFAVLWAWAAGAPAARAQLASRGVAPAWFAAFHAVSAFNNAGFTLFTDNVVGFFADRCVLLTLAAAIMLGNVASPLALRSLLRAAATARPRDARLRLLLDHPHVAFYNVFDAHTTRVVSAWFFLTTAFQFVSSLAVNFSNDDMYDNIAPASVESAAAAAAAGGAAPPAHATTRALIAFFMSVATRTAGFNAFNVIDMEASTVLIMAGMMFLTSVPTAGAPARVAAAADALAGGGAAGAGAGAGAGGGGYEGAAGAPAEGEGEGAADDVDDGVPHLDKRLLTALEAEEHPLAFAPALQPFFGDAQLIAGAVMLVCFADNATLGQPGGPRDHTIFGVVFELCSAYGTVGLTLSPLSLSLSAYLSTFSQLVVIAVMLAGRLRGLPLEADPAAALLDEWPAPAPAGAAKAPRRADAALTLRGGGLAAATVRGLSSASVRGLGAADLQALLAATLPQGAHLLSVARSRQGTLGRAAPAARPALAGAFSQPQGGAA